MSRKPVTHADTYSSLEELMTTTQAHVDSGVYPSGSWRKSWHGIGSWEEGQRLAVDGWDAERPEAERVAESAVSKVEQEHDTITFAPMWDVTGSAVDIGAFLAGEPENMIDFHQTPVTRNGKMITLCASVSYSGSIDTKTIKRRGHGIAALAFALTLLGYSVELWADVTASGSRTTATVRTLVKGTNDNLDAARIMFAYAHPAMLRAFSMGAMHSFPDNVQSALGVGYGYGMPTDPPETLPDGTIYLPSVRSSYDVPNADVLLREHLTKLGLIPTS